MAVAVADHLEEIAVFESVERFDRVHFLEAQYVGPCRRDRQCAVLPRIVGFRQSPGALQRAVLSLVPYLIKGQRAVPVQLVPEAGKVEAVHEVFDVEGGNANRHGGELCPQAMRNTSRALAQCNPPVQEPFRSCIVQGKNAAILAFGSDALRQGERSWLPVSRSWRG